MKKNAAIFLDKDGTLIPDIPYNVNPGLITLATDAIEGLKMLDNKGYKLIVVSNQSGIARGYFAEEAMIGVKEKLEQLLALHQIKLSGFYYCPHHTTNCTCRKPQPGMLLEAANDHQIDLERSWMIGDILNDVEAGNRAGCSSVLIDNGNETEWLTGPYRNPTLKCASINEAAHHILSLKYTDGALA